MTSTYPLLDALIQADTKVSIANAPTDLIEEIQQALQQSGFYSDPVDGIAGPLTQNALKAFKEAHWLEHPTLVGRSTAMALLEGKHPVAHEEPIASGDKTGASMHLPNGDLVYANQLIVTGIPLSWGEFTKNCTRIPESNEVVRGAIRFAKGFGEIRDKWGSPISLTSGYRPPAVNRAVGGATHSRHKNGDAGDIFPSNGSIFALLEVIKASSACGIGLGMHKGFIHVDYRPTGRVVFSY